MSHTLLGSIPWPVGTPADDPFVWLEAERSAELVARERGCEVISELTLIGSQVSPEHPDYVIHLFECQTTKPSPERMG